MTDPEVHVDNEANNISSGVQAGVVYGNITFGGKDTGEDTEANDT